MLKLNIPIMSSSQVQLFKMMLHSPPKGNRISGVMVSVLTLSAVDRGFEPQSGQTNDYKIGICCFSAKVSPQH